MVNRGDWSKPHGVRDFQSAIMIHVDMHKTYMMSLYNCNITYKW
jgi:hypothetical protein